MDYGEAIRLARTKAAMPQSVLGVRAGLGQSYLSHLERGKRQPSLAALTSIARALGLGILVLLSYGAEEEDVEGTPLEHSLLKGRIIHLCVENAQAKEETG